MNPIEKIQRNKHKSYYHGLFIPYDSSIRAMLRSIFEKYHKDYNFEIVKDFIMTFDNIYFEESGTIEPAANWMLVDHIEYLKYEIYI